jgi:hypothetical protein
MAVPDRESCHCCERVCAVSEMHQAYVETARQTHWSPAEADEVLVCEDCFTSDGPDEAYERAERSEAWQWRGGGGL